MYSLTNEQIAFIEDDIRRNGIETEEVRENLLDHICCIVEQTMKEGDHFEGVYQQTIQQFYETELKEIEKETQYLLTFKNYYVMKKLMIISGTSSAFLLLVGSFFKAMHLPGAGVLLVLGVVFFSMVFLPMLYVVKSKELKTAGDKGVLGLSIAMGSLLCLAAMFKVMHWPGANVMWISGIGISLIALLPLYFFNGIKNPDRRLNTIVTSVILVGVLGVLFMLTRVHRPVNNTVYQPTGQVEKR